MGIQRNERVPATQANWSKVSSTGRRPIITLNECREVKEKWIHAKYVERRFANKSLLPSAWSSDRKSSKTDRTTVDLIFNPDQPLSYPFLLRHYHQWEWRNSLGVVLYNWPDQTRKNTLRQLPIITFTVYQHLIFLSKVTNFYRFPTLNQWFVELEIL